MMQINHSLLVQALQSQLLVNKSLIPGLGIMVSVAALILLLPPLQKRGRPRRRYQRPLEPNPIPRRPLPPRNDYLDY